jgi:glycosyltransferase involved in cell wall biosynthesis
MTHEKISEEIPNSKEFIKIKRDAIMKADKIIAISNATRDDIIDFTNVPSERIVTVCLAATKVDLNLNNDSIWSKPYVLYVGARTLYKNFKNYLKACSKLEYDGDFLFLGGGRFTGDEIMLIDELKLSGRTFQVRGDELISKKLYMNADLFVYPSRYEGFGIPLLEAFQCRCKVVASDIKPFREIMGDEIEYFDPNDVDNMTYVIHNSLSKTAPSSEAAEKMTRKYSWENCAIQTLDVYKDLLTSK